MLPLCFSRATRDVHAKFLLRNGADEIVYPEKQMANWAAVRYSSDHIFDYIELALDYSIFETAVPSSWVENCGGAAQSGRHIESIFWLPATADIWSFSPEQQLTSSSPMRRSRLDDKIRMYKSFSKFSTSSTGAARTPKRPSRAFAYPIPSVELPPCSSSLFPFL